MREAGEKVSDDIKKEIQEKIDALKAVKDGDDVEAIKTKSQELSSTLSKIGEQLYKKDQQSTTDNPQPNEEKKE